VSQARNRRSHSLKTVVIPGVRGHPALRVRCSPWDPQSSPGGAADRSGDAVTPQTPRRSSGGFDDAGVRASPLSRGRSDASADVVHRVLGCARAAPPTATPRTSGETSLAAGPARLRPHRQRGRHVRHLHVVADRRLSACPDTAKRRMGVRSAPGGDGLRRRRTDSPRRRSAQGVASRRARTGLRPGAEQDGQDPGDPMTGGQANG
jgi:hypothetical protein